MKVSGIIVTTIVEQVLVDLDGNEPSDIPPGEIGELFMKVAAALSPKIMLSKQVQYFPLSHEAPQRSPHTNAEGY